MQAKWPGSSVSPTAQRRLNEPAVKSQSNQTVRPGTAPQLATYARGPVYSAVPRGNNEGRRLMNTLNEKYKRGYVQMPKRSTEDRKLAAVFHHALYGELERE